MILEIPTPSHIIFESAITMTLYANTQHFDLVTAQILPEDLQARPFVTADAWEQQLTYRLILPFANKVSITLVSKHREVLDDYMRAILANKDIVASDTREKYPEMFL